MKDEFRLVGVIWRTNSEHFHSDGRETVLIGDIKVLELGQWCV